MKRYFAVVCQCAGLPCTNSDQHLGFFSFLELLESSMWHLSPMIPLLFVLIRCQAAWIFSPYLFFPFHECNILNFSLTAHTHTQYILITSTFSCSSTPFLHYYILCPLPPSARQGMSWFIATNLFINSFSWCIFFKKKKSLTIWLPGNIFCCLTVWFLGLERWLSD